ncbi:MAG: hypothetical protein DYG98_17450 [Haliscomenobacteraceae bacterium CHB4]|nr:hypothetical protein [Saprospiraceae bacterium]MCE7924839.1 hypothetical protein [Haliscomenobacteraceae bacterium CHB4]
MKQKLAVIALLLCGAAFVQNNMPAIDPSGIIAIGLAKQKNGGALPDTGLIADPTGTAAIKTSQKVVKP